MSNIFIFCLGKSDLEKKFRGLSQPPGRRKIELKWADLTVTLNIRGEEGYEDFGKAVNGLTAEGP